MRSIGSFAGTLAQPYVLGGDCMFLPVSVVIDGSGDATLADDLNGLVSVARSTNTYTLTFKGNWAKTKFKTINNPVAATINCPLTITASAGTVACAFSGAVTSITFDVLLLVSTTTRG